MNQLLEKLGINERFTKNYEKQKKFNKIYNNIPHIANYNQMSDLLFLPTTKQGFKFLLVVVDLATRLFDVEPLKTKSAQTVLDALQKIYKRKTITQPYASLTTDMGTEFQGTFHKWLYNHDILQKVAVAGRHKQLSMVESLNKQLGRLLNGYMNSKEEETGRPYREWTDVLPVLRTELNKIRERNLPKDPVPPLKVPDVESPPKYKKGDYVHYKLDAPENILGEKQNTANFRMGDRRWSSTSHQITSVIMMNDFPNWRYTLEGVPNVSYSEYELIPSEQTQTTFKVKQILEKKKVKNRIHYLVWFRGDLKKNAVWLPRTQLIEDGVGEMLKAFDKTD
jgi:hypothetical protein